MSQLSWEFEGVDTLSPMQRAVNAGARALHHHYAIEDDTRTVADLPADEYECCASVAITAAYPHLFQALAKENRELRAKLAEHST